MPSKELKESPEVASVPEEVTGQPRRVILGHLLLRNTFVSLRHRNFRLFFAGQLVSLIGTWMQNTAQGWLVYQVTGSKLMLGIVAAADRVRQPGSRRRVLVTDSGRSGRAGIGAG